MKSFIIMSAIKPAVCAQHTAFQIILVCIDSACKVSRPCCLLCADSHPKHDMVSVPLFCQLMYSSLQTNRNNPDKSKIVKELNYAKSQLLQKLQMLKNKLLACIGKCEDLIDQYFGKLFHSFSVDSHERIIRHIESHFDSQTIDEILKQMTQFDRLVMGNYVNTQALLQVNMQVFKQKINEAMNSSQTAIQNMTNAFSQFNLAKPKEFIAAFSREKRQATYLTLSDSATTVIRTGGSGGYPLNLAACPFDPINTSVTFHVQKIGESGNKRSICIGACLDNVVKVYNYSNCVGLGKGIYAIDQCCPYSTQGLLASWNHHDTAFNQTNVGNNNLVGWSFGEGDRIRVEVDYFNGVVTFIKGEGEGQEEEEDIQAYEMPIKLDQGPIYAFASGASKGDRISIVG